MPVFSVFSAKITLNSHSFVNHDFMRAHVILKHSNAIAWKSADVKTDI